MTTSTRVLAGSAWALALVGLVVNVFRPLAPRVVAVVTDLDTFPPAVLDVIADYRQPRLAAAIVGLLLTVLVPALVVGTGPGRRVVARIADGRHPLLRGAAVAVFLVVLVRVVLLPLSFLMNHVREVDWGFRTAGVVDWLRDWALGVAIEVVVAALVGFVWLWLVRRRPDDWHWWVVLGATALSAVLVLVQPVLVEPLFLDTEPMAQGPLRDRLDEVLEAADVEADILVGDASRRTTRVNAFVTGLGPTRQIVLWDNLLDRPVDEVAAVVAHELAHREHEDIPRAVLLTAVGALPFVLVLRRLLGARTLERLGPGGPGDPRVVAVLVAAVALVQVVALPAGLWASRRAEAAADHKALVWTGDPAPLVRTFRGFVVRDLASPETTPLVSLFFATHPSVGARIRSTVATATASGEPLPSRAELEPAERRDRHVRIP